MFNCSRVVLDVNVPCQNVYLGTTSANANEKYFFQILKDTNVMLLDYLYTFIIWNY